MSIKDSEMAEMLTILSSLPGTETGKYLEELAGYSDEKLKKYLNGTDLKKAGIKTPYDIVLNLLRNKDKGLFSENSLFDALVTMIIVKDIPPDSFAAHPEIIKGNNLWILWIVIGAGLIIFFFVFAGRKKKKKK